MAVFARINLFIYDLCCAFFVGADLAESDKKFMVLTLEVRMLKSVVGKVIQILDVKILVQGTSLTYKVVPCSKRCRLSLWPIHSAVELSHSTYL